MFDGAVWESIGFDSIFPRGLCPSFDEADRLAVAFNNAANPLEPLGGFDYSLPTYLSSSTGPALRIYSKVPDLPSYP